MTLTVTIPDDLVEQVKAHGASPEHYVQGLIEEAVRADAIAQRIAGPRIDIEAFLTAMAQYAEKIPQLPDSAFTRESFYADHD